MRPHDIKTKIFLDSGDPDETRQVLDLLGFLDGQTTNPSLIAKKLTGKTKKFTRDELLAGYKHIVQEVASLLPQGSVSIEVYADHQTSADEMARQAREMFAWIPNGHIKFPTTSAGLAAAEMFIKEGGRVNMTLVFSQEQAAAVYAATLGAKKGDVFISPFIGRLDDRGEDGMSLIKNIIEMYKTGDSHVEVLVASVRSLDHFTQSLGLGADIITSPLKILKEWADSKFSKESAGGGNKLQTIPYQEISLEKNWHNYIITHELTTVGVQKFADDWNKLL
ncbi:MAG: transaldolase [Candidatus Magasanikbacteria bacterium RIFCSPHIGHO2_02_FULL_47_14]|uniref:Transaldolase n=1 Tax=Candidatus Magasanikbacteria bacterium RIFCSPHIGHO2_02_FULL_47_14 TaxID=1798680 RepID=A0A1F6MBD4_9BACT|nr:MAG: transaldolase [Candidatus Magasanikbacteria bacterium RIFCSPHIGHO2_02_FULL_47_14]